MNKHTASFVFSTLSLACAHAWADGHVASPVAQGHNDAQAMASAHKDKEVKENAQTAKNLVEKSETEARKSQELLPKEEEKKEEKPSFFSRLFNKKNASTQEVKLKPKYPVYIRSNNEDVLKMVEEYLPLITQQQQANLDREQVEFLAEDAVSNVQTMLKTKGYFNGKVTVNTKDDAYWVDITTGPRTKIENVSVTILGDVLTDDNLADYYKNAMNDWSLPVGNGFDQSEWNSSKTSVLSAVARKKYPLAKLTASQATINPQTNRADLSVQVQSNKPIYFGDIEVSGTKRYPQSVVLGLAQFKPGSPYDLNKLLDYQQALEQNGHYSGASVNADFDHLQGDRVPVKVEVSEVKRQKFETGIRYDSEYGVGGRLGYDHYNVFNRGYVGSVVVDADKYETTLAVGLSQPRNHSGHYWTTNVSYDRSTTQNLETKDLSSGVWHVRDRDNIESRIGLEYIQGSRRVPSTNTNLGTSHVTMLTASWKQQNINTLLRPENGYYLDVKVGSTLGRVLSSAYMARSKVRAGYFFTPENKKIGTFIVRGQLGYTYVNDKSNVPSSLLFRTGGANSVRGYELNSIGLPGPDGSVLPNRALAVASFEYQYPFAKNFAAAVFEDMGDVATNFKQMSFKYGTGIGIRWFSPVAPFSFDIAYGHSDKKLRWHISLGTRF